jgi:hypothetical protein
VLGAEVAGAKAAVADDALGGFLALLEVATWLAGRHCDLVVNGLVWRERDREGYRER